MCIFLLTAHQCSFQYIFYCLNATHEKYVVNCKKYYFIIYFLSSSDINLDADHKNAKIWYSMTKELKIQLECIMRYNMSVLITSYDQQTVSETNKCFKQNMFLHRLFGKFRARFLSQIKLRDTL